MPSVASRALRIFIGVDEQYLRRELVVVVIIPCGRVDMQRPEPTPEFDVFFHTQILITKEQYQVVKKSPVNGFEIAVSQIGEIHAGYLGTNMRGYR